PKDANGNPLSGRVVTWSSNNTSVATVDAGGLVTAGAVGSATITATSEGKSGTAGITVTAVPGASVTVSPAAGSVPGGRTAQLSEANGSRWPARVITWQASNNATAGGTGGGLVGGGGAGGPITTTATREGHSGTAAVTVTTSSGANSGTCSS